MITLEDLERIEKTTTDPEKRALLKLLYITLRYNSVLEEILSESEDPIMEAYLVGLQRGMMEDKKEFPELSELSMDQEEGVIKEIKEAFNNGYEEGQEIHSDMKERFDGGLDHLGSAKGWVN